MRKRAMDAMSQAGYDAAQAPAIAALVDYAAQAHGIDPRNYFRDHRDRDGVTAYRQECRDVQNAWRRVVDALCEAANVGVTDAEVIAESKHAYSGRLTWTGKGWDYCTGQYWPTEYRHAVATVLAYATRARRQAMPPKSRTVTNITELKALNHENGGCWFDRSTMRFFGTRIESQIIRGRYFVTSERPPHGPRGYTIRSFDSEGSIDTVGELCGYKSRAEAMAAVRAMA